VALPVTRLLIETGPIYCLATLVILILLLCKEQGPRQIIILNAVSLFNKSLIFPINLNILASIAHCKTTLTFHIRSNDRSFCHSHSYFVPFFSPL
jgi:hypothetical protein